MRTALDTNVISYFFFGDEVAQAKAKPVIRQALQDGEVLIGPVVYAEMAALAEFDETQFDHALKQLGITVDWAAWPKPLWQGAGQRYGRFAQKRKQLATPRRLLADFLVIAHAGQRADRLLTFDRGLVRAASDPTVVDASTI